MRNRETCLIRADRLRLVGRKRKWVPITFWVEVVFRFRIYEWPIIGPIFYKRSAGAGV